MTLNIEIQAIKNLIDETEQLKLQIESQTSEPIQSQPVSAFQPIFDPQIIYTCGVKGELTFRVLRKVSEKDQWRLISEGTFSIPFLIRKKNFGEHSVTNYNFLLENEEKCYVRCKVYYNPVKIFIGNLSKSEYSFEALEIHESLPVSPIAFYKGPCPTRNMFSMMDRGVKETKFNLIEKKYSKL